MTKVTRKIFAVLEFVVAKGGRGVLPSEIVAALKINQATCIRILKDLVELGYLERISRQRGYAPGAMTNWLGFSCAYKKELVAAAAPLVEECARASGQSTLFAIRRGARRFVLAHLNCNPRIYVDVTGPWWADFYYTATGRVLAAYADDAGLEEIVDALGLPPKKDWPEASSSFAALRDECAKIRENGIVSYERGNDLFITAFPIFKDGALEGSLGMSVPCRELKGEADKARYVSFLQNAAQALNSKLSSVRSAG